MDDGNADLVDRLWEAARSAIAEQARLPESTYRLQFHAGFTFNDATRITPYLRDLGVTHCYASPYLKARPGSTHGYDIVDHGRLNPEVGSAEDYDNWVRSLQDAGLRQVLDTVPNHMGVGTNENAWWNDVLENGPASRFANHFDIAWRVSSRPELQDKVLLPVLGEPYGEVLEAGQLKLAFEDGGFAIRYYDRRLPVSPCTYARILAHGVDELTAKLGPESAALLEFQSIITAARNLPDRTQTDPAKVAERNREKEVIKRRLAAVAMGDGDVRGSIEANVAVFNGVPGDPESFSLLDDLLENQCYRLSYWRVAPDEINYRRFFDINDLAALSMERQEVFDEAHALILRLLVDRKVDGLRIDHPDGLYDPEQYFSRLQEAFLLAEMRAARDRDPEFKGTEWATLEEAARRKVGTVLAEGADHRRWPLYVVAEKILGAAEPLVESWAVRGTSGYDFVNVVNGLLVNAAAEELFTRFYRELLGDETPFTELAYRKKLLVLGVSLASELHTLTYQLDRLAQKSRKSRDFTFNTLRRALREVIACFPVYRSYIADGAVADTDRRHIEVAIRKASVRNPLLGRRVFKFIRGLLLLEYPPPFTDDDKAEQRRFVGKFQQVTSPVTAKGIEDTAFYVYNRFISLNEVGGEPNHFGVSAVSAHAYNMSRQVKWPYAMSPLSTHDTKRSEDVRARLNVLSEMPDEWFAAVNRWRRLNESLRAVVDDAPAPDANEEYLLYQTLVGAWPLEPYCPDEYAAFIKRVQKYMEKALHEAKVHTSWINPNEDYDKAVADFVARMLDEKANQAFHDDLREFRHRVSSLGLFNSLAQTLLKFTCPGVPDTYQGTELWDFSLVDPDNRRPVDYETRATMLRELHAAAADGQDLTALARGLVDSKEDGRIKLYVTTRALQFRRDNAGLLSAGEYVPLEATGAAAASIFAFARRAGDRQAIVAVPRLLAGIVADGSAPLGETAWRDTRIGKIDPGVRWRNIFSGETFTGETLAVADLFRHFPVALLTST